MGPLGMAAVETGQNIANGILGIGLGAINDKRQRKQQEKLTKIQSDANKDLARYSSDLQYDMWQKTNYKAQMAELNKAGLNPGLLYGMSGGGGVTTGSANAGSAAGAAAAGSTNEAMGMMLMDAQRKVLETQAELNKAKADKTTGADTANINADTENKIIQSALNKEGLRQLTEIYDHTKRPFLDIEGETLRKEMEARQGVAWNIYELSVEGKLKDKSLAEIESIAISNAKSEAEINKIKADIKLIEANTRGVNINNIISDLEMQLQKQTGIDRNSPTWLKIIGRLFVGLTQKQ